MVSLTLLNDLAPGWLALMAQVSVRAALLLVAAWLICSALRKHSAALRHVIWLLSLTAVAATPFLLDVTPTLQISSGWASSSLAGEADPAPRIDVGPVFSPLPIDPSAAAAIQEEPEASEYQAIAPIASASSDNVEEPASVASVFVGVWILGCFLFVTRLVAGYVRVRLVAQRAEKAADFEGLTRQLEIGQPVRFVQSTAMPRR